MKYLLKINLFVMAIALMFASCDKKDMLATHGSGTDVTLSASTTSIVPSPGDSSNVATTFSWTSPNYDTDSATYKYILEIDTSSNFTNPYQKIILGARDTAFSNKELNTVALSFGFAFNIAYDMYARVISSYSNNNEQYISNTVKLNYTPYKVPPKIALPASGKLFLVGDASQGGWNNPVPTPTQEFAQIDETTFGGVFNLVGGKQFLLLPVNGDWTNKYGNVCGSDGCNDAAGADFKEQGNNFKGPDADGWYTIIVNFQTGKFSVTPYTGTLATDLFMVGAATPGGWNNPVPVPSQQFTRVNSSVFTLTLPITGGQQFLFLPVNGDWSNKYGAICGSDGCNNAMGDNFMYGGNNFKGPETSGTYTFTVNFVTGRFTVE